MTWQFRFLVVLMAALPGLAMAQTIRVSAGEHADFTRLVLRVPNDLAWSIEGSGPQQRFVTDRDVAYDLSRVFDLIPRTRLAAVRQGPEGLILDLACDCPTRAWQDRPGIVVVDISDPPPAALTGQPPPPESPRPPDPVGIAVPMRQTVIEAARVAGEALARARAESLEQAGDPVEGIDPAAMTGLAEDLGRQFAQALGQGLLEPSVENAERGAVLRAEDVDTELPANMRVIDVTERPSVEGPPEPVPDPSCRGAEELDFLLDRDGPAFSEGLGQYGQALFGEFDQASGQGFLELARHYLAAGLGAEARVLITNVTDPLPGRDLLLGFSDVLEGRMSNSRMRLAEAVRCGGAAAVGAVLAHPRTDALPDIAQAVTLSFGRLPPTLRAALGPELVGALLAAGARDEARIVADALRQSPWAQTEDRVMADALLEESRGDPDRAADHLDTIALRSIEGTLAWLELALDQGTIVAFSALEDAEAIAAENRETEAGIAIMAATIRLRARSAQPDSALVALDRLEAWNDGHDTSRALVATLRDEVWSTLADTSDDHALLAMTLARSDWLAPELSLSTRQALAARLVDLGFARAAERLLATETDARSLRLRAAAALQQGDPTTALRLIESDSSPEAVPIRAAGESLAGNHAEAAAVLDDAGIVDAAARAAILDGDWRRIDDLRRRGAETDALPQDVNNFLGVPPGLAEIARSRTATPTEEEPSGETATSATAAASTPPQTSAATSDPPLDPAEVLDRMGMVSRAGLLLAESERLRDAIGQTLQPTGQP